MNNQYIEMCKNCDDMKEFWNPKPGDLISIIWSNPMIGGMEDPHILNNNPVYGLNYYKNQWFINNGLIINKHCMCLLQDIDIGAKVVWYPRLSELALILETEVYYNIYDVLDIEIFKKLKNDTLGVYILKIIMMEVFNKKWSKNNKKWEKIK